MKQRVKKMANFFYNIHEVSNNDLNIYFSAIRKCPLKRVLQIKLQSSNGIVFRHKYKVKLSIQSSISFPGQKKISLLQFSCLWCRWNGWALYGNRVCFCGSRSQIHSQNMQSKLDSNVMVSGEMSSLWVCLYARPLTICMKAWA